MVAFRTHQPPRPLPPLRGNKRTAWVRVRAIGLDSNGNDATGVYFGRGRSKSLYRIDYPDATWCAFWELPGNAMLVKLARLYPKAKLEVGPMLPLAKGVNWDHSKNESIDLWSSETIPTTNLAQQVRSAPERGNQSASGQPANLVNQIPGPITSGEWGLLNRGERWKRLRDARRLALSSASSSTSPFDSE